VSERTGAEDWRALNRANWDERVAVHLAPAGYDLGPLRAGQGRLDAIVEAELGPVAGQRVLHLQCHFGKESLVLASRGAEVTGLDFSAPAIEAARALAAELKLPARFVQADLYDAPSAIPGAIAETFDLVFTTWGTITWLPDVAGGRGWLPASCGVAGRSTSRTPTRRRWCSTTWPGGTRAAGRAGSCRILRGRRWCSTIRATTPTPRRGSPTSAR
jgi:SAM-dependent methyltransferase